MTESINNHGFKLLAIRPLGNTSSELLKGLTEKCIYKFYSDFIYNLDEDENVISIKYLNTVPSNLYGENISISAIVGQNGSGKSSLLEVFYYFLFCYSRTEGLLKNDNNLSKIGTKNFHFEFYYLAENEIHCIEWDNINLFKKRTFTLNKENQTYERYSDIQSYENGNDYKIPFYNIVINYSIYGLNSTDDDDRWFDKLFIKNDGYQTPIVLNPYREDGNINVNREFELANSRLLKIFLSTSIEFNDFNTSTLIKDVSVNHLLFKLDIDKNLTAYLNQEHQEIENIVSTFESINDYKIKNFFEKIYISFNKNIIFRDLKYVYSRFGLLNNDTSFGNLIDLSNLYILKKIIKIVHNYKNYKFFENIFIKVNIGDLKSNTSVRQLYVNQYYKLFIVDENLNPIEIIDDAKKRFDFEKSEEKIIEKSLLKYFYRFYDESFINEIYNNNYIDDNIIENISIYDSINIFLNKFNDLLNSKKVKHKLIDLLLHKLNTDSSHITLKLRQVLNMQESNFFENLLVTDKKNVSISDEKQIIYFTVKNEYLSKSKNLSIEEIPNAFLEPIFKFNKKNTEAPFELKYLSSGEQQLLHSTISVSYHIDNLLSIIENKEESELRLYKEINIILDEIELYYHPEYQREYIENLITLLSQEKYKGLNFNVIFSTHSPFILSDIPSQNILKLKHGESRKNDRINSFAANIYDLLKDEFFLKDGAIGIFASNKISEVLSKSIIEKDDLDIINLIGDPFLKGVIKKKIEDKLSTSLINKEILRLQEILKNKSTNDTDK